MQGDTERTRISRRAAISATGFFAAALAILGLVFFLSPMRANAQISSGTVSVCGKGTDRCGNSCTDLSTDTDNCGRCNRACGVGETCSKGACTVSTQGSCKPGQMTCGARCVNVGKDDRNCGACNNVCDSGKTCSGGTCRKPAVKKPTIPGRMPNPWPLPAPAPGPSGGGGQSPSGCDADKTWCMGRCVSNIEFINDSQNCGRCGNSCSINESCTGGSCSCGAGSVRCMGSCMDRGSLMSDTNNCGRCGNICSIGQSCMGGSCTRIGPCRPGDITCRSALTEPVEELRPTRLQLPL